MLGAKRLESDYFDQELRLPGGAQSSLGEIPFALTLGFAFGMPAIFPLSFLRLLDTKYQHEVTGKACNMKQQAHHKRERHPMFSLRLVVRTVPRIAAAEDLSPTRQHETVATHSR